MGTYAEIAWDLNDVCSELEFKIFQSTGSMQNIEKILKDPDAVNFGITQLDALQFLKKTKSKLPYNNIKMVLPLYSEEIHLVVKASSKIKNLEALKGKRVNVGPRDSGTRVTADMIKKSTGLKWKESYLLFEEALRALLENKIDAFFYVIGIPVPYFTQLSNEVMLVDVRHKSLKKLYIPTKIPANTYPWQKRPVKTYKVPSLLITHTKVSNIKIQKLVQCIIEKHSHLKKKKHKKWEDVNLQDYKKIKWPMHPVVKKALRKK